MSPTDFATLYQKMGDFLADRTENDGWCHDGLQSQMAHAARAVYDACMDGQKFAKEQAND